MATPLEENPNDQHPNETLASPDAPLSHVDKKIRRAERFGIFLQLSEREKRNSRAQRFGTTSASESSDESKLEELKRKARAERFGMPTLPTAADEDAKKKARLARFAPVSNTDPLEEEKGKREHKGFQIHLQILQAKLVVGLDEW